jgi:outer membrane cobalamin receptor
MPAFAIVFGSVKGIVHDPQHRPVPGVSVVLKARNADLTQMTTTGPEGDFQFPAVPVGDYVVSVAVQGFKAPEQAVTVVSTATPVMHFQLELAELTQSVTVSAEAATARGASMTPTTLVNQQNILATPGADQSNSPTAITAFVPGAYMVHDQLHVRGGHQVSWLIDGVQVPNTNIASNVGPQFDPKDIDVLEVQRGSYGAQYGDRTYAIFNVVPRTGFERNREAELVLGVGSYFQTDDQFNVGSHTGRFAYYASANFNRSDLGLQTPVPDVYHADVNGGGGFASFIFNSDSNNQFRLVTSARRDNYQVPTGPDEQAEGIADEQHESDAFVNLTWARTFGSSRLLTVSPFYHQNSANFDGGPLDPVSTTSHNLSQYLGAQSTFGVDLRRHSIQAGFYGFLQRDDHAFGVTFNDGSAPDVAVHEEPTGHLEAVYVQDAFAVANWLTLTGGIRQTHFAGGVTEDATSPRVGATATVPALGWTLRAFYGHFYQAPPLVTASGPAIDFVTEQNLGFIPLKGERDEEYQAGITIPIRGWETDLDYFHTDVTNLFDHNNVGNSNVFYPVTIEGGRIRGWELTVRSPRTWQGAEVHLAYAYQHADGFGAINGGLTDFAPAEGESFPLDHDQRHTLSVGFSAMPARSVVVAANVYYGSGVPDGESETGAYLEGHTTLDLSARKTFGSQFSVGVTALNVTNERVLIDNSLTFGGTHYNRPREISVQVRYRFHY